MASAPTPQQPRADEPTNTEPEPVTQETPVLVLDPVVPVSQVAAVEVVEEAELLEPVELALRVKTAVRVGAWTGAALGVIGFLVATAFWASNTTMGGDGRPVMLATPRGVIIGAALVSIVFGAMVASLSRAAASWRDPAMQLSSSRSSTGWFGAAIGLVLGVAAAGVLTGLGTPVELSEPPLVQLPVLATMGVILIGGALLGAITAALPQVFGTPVAVADEDAAEVAEVRGRIGHAITIPLAGLLLLLILVLPFAFALLEANHLMTNGAALIAIIAAGGILGFAALAGSKPHVRISLGEVMVALVGVGTVITIILAVFVFRGP